ncbi:MAG: DUF11 domain-containing protein [Sphingomonas sp.]|nr:DUF11 domain-containing protein [Sphingomonas sp.]
MRRALLPSAVAALVVAGPTSTAQAATSCDNTNLYSYAFSSAPTTQLSYGGTTNYTATNGAAATRTFSVNITQNGLTSTSVNGDTLPRIDSTPLSTSTGGRVLNIGGVFGGRTASITGATRVIVTTFTFATPIRELTLSVNDIDYTNNQYRDWLWITGSDGTSTYADPVLTLQSPTSARIGPGGSPSLAANEAIGTGTANTGATTGDMDILFNEPVTSVSLRYGNYPLSAGEALTGQQALGVVKLSFCPLPSVTVTKTSAPYDTTGVTRFAVPGADVAYTLTVTNSGGSKVDLNSLVLADVLPANVTFYNGDFNPGSPGMGPFELTAGSSTVTLPASGRSYSDNGGATYTYTPSAGYDPNVKALKLIPSGTMAANSSFTIRFRARVN